MMEKYFNSWKILFRSPLSLGLVMVNFYNKFLSCNENATVHDAVGMYGNYATHVSAGVNI